MPLPIPFDEQNTTFHPPESRQRCLPLPAFEDRGQVVTCWQFTPEEIARIQETGVIWLYQIIGPNRLQPIALLTEKPIVPNEPQPDSQQ